jgi:hypothetical protein
MDDTNSPSDKQALVDSWKKTNDAYENLSDEIASLIEAGKAITPDLQARHSAAMRAAVIARNALEKAEDEEQA